MTLTPQLTGNLEHLLLPINAIAPDPGHRRLDLRRPYRSKVENLIGEGTEDLANVDITLAREGEKSNGIHGDDDNRLQILIAIVDDILRWEKSG